MKNLSWFTYVGTASNTDKAPEKPAETVAEKPSMAAALSAIKIPASPTAKQTMADALKAAAAAETENKPQETLSGEQLVNCFSMELTSNFDTSFWC